MSVKEDKGDLPPRLIFDEIDSTNAEAFRRAPDLQGPLWILAGHQTAGRGRRARAWISPRGNFTGSLIRAVEGGPQGFGLRSFTAALALYDALAEAMGESDNLALKWPNDVLLFGGKLTGILLEATGRYLVIGIGVNLVAAPPPDVVERGAVVPVSLAEATGLRLSPEAFLDHLAPAMEAWEQRLLRDGFAPVRAAWLARAARLGERITARTMRETYHGVFETIEADGSLRLREDTGATRLIQAADIFF